MTKQYWCARGICKCGTEGDENGLVLYVRKSTNSSTHAWEVHTRIYNHHKFVLELPDAVALTY